MAREGIDIIHSDGTTETWYATSATVGMENPMSNSGDMIVGGTDGAPVSLSPGTEGQFLITSSGAPTWATVPSANGQSF